MVALCLDGVVRRDLCRQGRERRCEGSAECGVPTGCRVQREKQWIDSSRVELRSALGPKWVGCEQGGRGLTNSSSELDVLCGNYILVALSRSRLKL